MKKILYIFIALLSVKAQAQLSLSRHVVGSAGTSGTVGTYQVDYTIGEPVTNSLSNQTYTFSQGFQQAENSCKGIAGTISGTTALCTGNTGTTLTLSGHTGTIAWYKGTVSGTTVTFGTTSVGSLTTLATGALTTSIAYRAIITNGTCKDTTTSFVITVSSAAVAGTAALNNTTDLNVCSGGSKSLKLTGSTGSIQWQASTLSATTGFEDVSGVSTSTPTFSNITQNTWYRAKVSSGACPTLYSNVLAIVAKTPTAAGSISSAASMVCSGSATTLTLSDYSGTILWQKSTNYTATTPTWTTATGTTATFATGALTAATAFRAVLSNSPCPSSTSGVFVVGVSPTAVAGTITASATTVCSGSPSTLTLANYTGSSIQWQSAMTAGGTFTNIAGANASTYTTGNLTASSPLFYKAVVSSGVCTTTATQSAATSIVVSAPSVAGSASGVYGSATTGTSVILICSTNAGKTMLTGNTGLIQWQQSTDNVTFTDISAATSATYTTPSMTQTTWYRAKVTNGACPAAFSGKVQFFITTPVSGTVNTSTNFSNSLCASAAASGTSLSLSGNTGSIVWQKSSNWTATAPTWTAITGATTTTLLTGAMTTSTAYRAVSTVGSCTAPTNAFVVTVSPLVVTKTISGTASVCSGTNTATLTLASGTVGSIQWQQSTDNVNWSNLGNVIAPTLATNALNTLTQSNLTESNWYRVLLSSGACPSAVTTAYKVTSFEPSVAGSITGISGLCIPNAGSTLTLGTSTGTIAWYKAPITNGVVGTFSVISAQTASTLATGMLSASSAYRATVTSGPCPSVNSNTFSITVSPAVVSKTISGTTAVCTGTNAATLTLASGSVGSIQWQQSTDNTTWTNIGNVITPTLATNAANALTQTNLTQNTWYRVILSSGVCTAAATTAFQVLVNQPSVSGSINGTLSSLCGTNTGATLTLSGNTGTVVWQKSTNWSSATPTWAAITGATANTLATGALTASTAFRSVVKNGVCPSVNTSEYVLSYAPAVVTKTITQNTTTPSGATQALALCTSSTAKVLTLGAGYVGTIQWQRSTNNTNWTDISGASAATYTITSPTLGQNYYRVKLTSGSCNAGYTASVFVWYKVCVKSEENIAETSSVFEVISYPNPYENYFQIQLNTTSEESVSIKVYDLLGKMVEHHHSSISEINDLQLGKNLASGDYTIEILQGEEIIRKKVIKQ